MVITGFCYVVAMAVQSVHFPVLVLMLYCSVLGGGVEHSCILVYAQLYDEVCSVQCAGKHGKNAKT